MYMKNIIILLISLIFLNIAAEDIDLDLDLDLEKPKKEKEEEETVNVFELGGTTVEVDRNVKAQSISSYNIELGELSIIPRRNASEQLMLAPGVLITNAGGDGHAHSTYMRGFAAKEGQDIEFLVDGVPLNEISNPHGHGYTDLHFIIPEVVKTVSIKEGPFDPEQGDFAFAGSADYKLGVAERGSRISTGYGLWNSSRSLLLIAPENQDEQTFGAFEFFTTDGFGKNRAAMRSSAIGRYSGGGDYFSYKATVFGYISKYDQAGVLRLDDYENGRIGFFDTYDQNQGGNSRRFLASFNLFSGEKNKSELDQVAYFGYRSMKMKENFTGFKNDVDQFGVSRPVQRGDNLELRYNVFQVGAKGKFNRYGTVFERDQLLEMGYSIRFDHGDSSQFRLSSELGNPYSELFDDSFSVGNISGFAGYNIQLLEFLRLRTGLRIDTFLFNVIKKSEPHSPLQETTDYPDQSIQAYGFTLNPRTGIDVNIFKGLNAIFSYGHATRSVDAMSLSDNEAAPFARSHQIEGGLSYSYGKEGDSIYSRIQAGYVFAKIDKDMSFNPDLGRNLSVSPSVRHAFLFSGRIMLGNWFDSLTNIGYTFGYWDSTVPDSHNKGDLIENVPSFILKQDIAVNRQIGKLTISEIPVTGRIGAGFTYMPGMPLRYQERGKPMYLLNLCGEARVWYFTAGMEIRNLLNLKYHSAEFNYSSNFNGPESVGSKLPQKHFVAGEPFYIFFSLTWHFEELFSN